MIYFKLKILEKRTSRVYSEHNPFCHLMYVYLQRSWQSIEARIRKGTLSKVSAPLRFCGNYSFRLSQVKYGEDRAIPESY